MLRHGLFQRTDRNPAGYSAGGPGTRETIERAGFEGHADLLIALGRLDLPFPPPADWPGREAHLAEAAAILQPLLREQP